MQDGCRFHIIQQQKRLGPMTTPINFPLQFINLWLTLMLIWVIANGTLAADTLIVGVVASRCFPPPAAEALAAVFWRVPQRATGDHRASPDP